MAVKAFISQYKQLFKKNIIKNPNEWSFASQFHGAFHPLTHEFSNFIKSSTTAYSQWSIFWRDVLFPLVGIALIIKALIQWIAMMCLLVLSIPYNMRWGFSGFFTHSLRNLLFAISWTLESVSYGLQGVLQCLLTPIVWILAIVWRVPYTVFNLYKKWRLSGNDNGSSQKAVSKNKVTKKTKYDIVFSFAELRTRCLDDFATLYGQDKRYTEMANILLKALQEENGPREIKSSNSDEDNSESLLCRSLYKDFITLLNSQGIHSTDINRINTFLYSVNNKIKNHWFVNDKENAHNTIVGLSNKRSLAALMNSYPEVLKDPVWCGYESAQNELMQFFDNNSEVIEKRVANTVPSFSMAAALENKTVRQCLEAYFQYIPFLTEILAISTINGSQCSCRPVQLFGLIWQAWHDEKKFKNYNEDEHKKLLIESICSVATERYLNPEKKDEEAAIQDYLIMSMNAKEEIITSPAGFGCFTALFYIPISYLQGLHPDVQITYDLNDVIFRELKQYISNALNNAENKVSIVEAWDDLSFYEDKNSFEQAVDNPAAVFLKSLKNPFIDSFYKNNPNILQHVNKKQVKSSIDSILSNIHFITLEHLGIKEDNEKQDKNTCPSLFFTASTKKDTCDSSTQMHTNKKTHRF